MSRELREIVERFDALSGEGERAVLATVIDVRGSSYRLPGARMLIDENGDTAGTVSGGCLEADILERAKRVMASGAAEVFVYDTRATDDSVFGLNMGCRGVIRILLEPAGSEIAEFLRRRPEARSAAALATVVDTAEGGPPVGARLLVDVRGETAVGLGPEARAALSAECTVALAEGRSHLRTLELGEVFVEVVAPPLPLVVFGAGHDAVPVARLAKDLGWRVVVVDHRPAYATRERFRTADDVILARPEEVGERVEVDDRTAIVLMTHNYQHDLGLLRFALESPARYIGALGPRRRTEQLLDELGREGFAPPASALDRLHAPIGVDIGAEAPEEIALSIVAEIRAVTNGRNAGMLREHTGAIHGRADDARPLPFADRESAA